MTRPPAAGLESRSGEGAPPVGAEAREPKVGVAVRSALFWNLSNQVVTQAASALVFVLLARELTPADLGVYALAALVVDAFANETRVAAVDLLLLRRDFSDRFLSTVLAAGMGAALLAAAALASAAPLLASLAQAPALARLLPALALSLLASPLLAVLEALALKDLRFRLFAFRSMASTAGASAAALLVLSCGGGAWAFVAQRLCASAVAVGLLWSVLRWTPALRFDPRSAVAVAGPFLKLWSAQLTNFALGRVTDLIVGFGLGVGPLGLLRAGSRVLDLGVSALLGPLSGVFVPVLARSGDEGVRTGDLLQLTALAALLAAPAFAGLALVAPELVQVVFGARYEGSGPALRLLALATLPAPFTYFRSVTLVARGRAALATTLGVADLLVTAAMVGLGSAWGLTPALEGALAAGLIASAASVLVTARAYGLPAGRLLSVTVPPYLGAAVMTVAVLGAAVAAAGLGPPARLALEIGAGVVAFCAYIFAVHRPWLRERLRYLQIPGAISA